MQAKRMKMIAALAIGLVSIAAAIPGTAAAGEQKADKTAKGRKICRSLIPTGSRFSTRVCRTKEEWAEMQDKAQTGLLDYQRNNESTVESMPDGSGTPR
jgi:type II secretory pathway component PulL